MAEDKVKSEEEKVEDAAATESETPESDAPKAEEKEAPKKLPKFRRTARGKKRLMKKVPQGRAYVKSTYNNTIVTLTDMNGNTLAWASAGNCGFRGPKKATPYAAGVIVKSVAEKVSDFGLKEVMVYVKGIGSGRDAAVRALNANGFTIIGIKDVTPLPHNGCRLAGRRRI